MGYLHALRGEVEKNERRVEQDVAGLQNYMQREYSHIYGRLTKVEQMREVGQNMLTGDPSLTKPGGAGGTLEQQPERPRIADSRSTDQLKKQWIQGYKQSRVIADGLRDARQISQKKASEAYEAEFGDYSGDELRAALANGIDGWASLGILQTSIQAGPITQMWKSLPVVPQQPEGQAPPLQENQPQRSYESGNIHQQHGSILHSKPNEPGLFEKEGYNFEDEPSDASGLLSAQPTAEESTLPSLEFALQV